MAVNNEIKRRDRAAMRIWEKLRTIPGPNAVQKAQKLVLSGYFSADELAWIVTVCAMYPLALAEARAHNQKEQG